MNLSNTRLKELHRRPVATLQVELAQTRRELQEVKTRLTQLEGEVRPLQVTDSVARRMIERYITKRKSEGITELSTLDFMDDLKLPAEQIIRIMNTMNAKGVQ